MQMSHCPLHSKNLGQTAAIFPMVEDGCCEGFCPVPGGGPGSARCEGQLRAGAQLRNTSGSLYACSGVASWHSPEQAPAPLSREHACVIPSSLPYQAKCDHLGSGSCLLQSKHSIRSWVGFLQGQEGRHSGIWRCCTVHLDVTMAAAGIAAETAAAAVRGMTRVLAFRENLLSPKLTQIITH